MSRHTVAYKKRYPLKKVRLISLKQKIQMLLVAMSAVVRLVTCSWSCHISNPRVVGRHASDQCVASQDVAGGHVGRHHAAGHCC